MKLDELKQPNRELTKSYLNLLYKSAKSAQDDVSKKSGLPKLNVDGTRKQKAKPLTADFGERRALRGSPTTDNPNGPIIGSGGEMHNPISPADAAKELARIGDEMRTGKSLPFSQLPDQADSFDAVTMRNKRSAPGRSAVWPNGAKWDSDGPYHNMNRTVVSPDGTRKVTRKRPLKVKEKERHSKLLDPTEKRNFKRRAARTRRRRVNLAGKYFPPPETEFSAGKVYNTGTIDENFIKSLDRALGL